MMKKRNLCTVLVFIISTGVVVGDWTSLPKQSQYILKKEGESLKMKCELQDGTNFIDCRWSHNNYTLAKIDRGQYGFHIVSNRSDLHFESDINYLDVKSENNSCVLEIFNAELERDGGNWECHLSRPNPPDENFQDGDHSHTGKVDQQTVITVEVLRYPNFNLIISDQNQSGVPSFLVDHTYSVECTAEGGNPKAKLIWAIFHPFTDKSYPYNLVYFTGKATARPEHTSNEFSRKFSFTPTLSHALQGGGILSCNYEQETEKETILTNYSVTINNTIYFKPYLSDKHSEVAVFYTSLGEKIYKIFANPPPDVVKLSLNPTPNNKETIKAINLNYTFENNLVLIKVTVDLLRQVSKKSLNGLDFRIDVMTRLGAVQLFLSVTDNMREEIYYKIIACTCLVILILVLVLTVIKVKSRQHRLREEENSQRNDCRASEIIFQRRENPSANSQQKSSHRRPPDRANTWCPGDKINERMPLSSYSRNDDVTPKNPRPEFEESKLI